MGLLPEGCSKTSANSLCCSYCTLVVTLILVKIVTTLPGLPYFRRLKPEFTRAAAWRWNGRLECMRFAQRNCALWTRVWRGWLYSAVPGAPAWKWSVHYAGPLECSKVLVKSPYGSVAGTQRWCATYVKGNIWLLSVLGRRIPRHCRPRSMLKFTEQRRENPMLSQPDDARSLPSPWGA